MSIILSPYNLYSPIVANGLVLHLDAGEIQSYSGVGDTWFDLSGNNNNGTIINGATYNTLNGGSLVFNGLNQYVNTNLFLNNSPSAISVWFKAGAQTTDTSSILRPIVMYGNFSNTPPDGIDISMIRDGNADVGKLRCSWGDGINSPYNLMTDNRYDNSQWYFVTMSNRGQNFDVYINSSFVGTRLTTNYILQDTRLQIAGSSTAEARKLAGSIAQVLVYNRALTQQEVQQNFSGTRRRFNI